MDKDIENELANWKKQIDDIEVPQEKLDDAIFTGLNQAKNGNSPSRFNYKVVLGLTALFLFLVGCVATIWLVNPELLNDNKGLQDAMNHEYYQAIDKTEAVNGVEVTLQGAIVDEKGFVLFYTVETDRKYREVFMNDFEITDMAGNDIDFSSISYGAPNLSEKEQNKFEGKIELFTIGELPTFDFIMSFDLGARTSDGLVAKGSRESFEIPFSLDEDDISPRVDYELDEEIVIDHQKIRLEKMSIYPLRAELTINLDKSNSKRILDFSDLKMIDEDGKDRAGIMNGMTSSMIDEDENKQIIYLQSNYFTDPEELYVTLSKIQALDKNELDVLVDLDEEKIVKQPASEKFIDFSVQGRHLVFVLQDDEEFPFGTFAYVKDEAGNELDVLSSGMSSWVEHDSSAKHIIEVAGLSKMTGKLILPLSFYPEWIEASEEIKVKVK